MKVPVNLLFAVSVAAVVAACASTADYMPPERQVEEQKVYTAIVDKSYDDTWSALIRHAAGAFFAIDNFEKESGLLTLSFGSGDPSAFIDCGELDAVWFDALYEARTYSGSYVDFLMLYHSGNFSGKMNLLVTELNPTQSEVTVNARYILQAPPNVWSFDSGGKSSRRVTNESQSAESTFRTCQPTYKAEMSILDAVKGLSQ